jgi:HSP20 family protein
MTGCQGLPASSACGIRPLANCSTQHCRFGSQNPSGPASYNNVAHSNLEKSTITGTGPAHKRNRRKPASVMESRAIASLDRFSGGNANSSIVTRELGRGIFMLRVLRPVNGSALSPFVSINRLENFFDRAFGEDRLLQSGVNGESWTTVPLALWHDDDNLFVEAELPGVAEEHVDVTVHNGVLFLRGERKPAEGRKYFYNSRGYGRFERVINLPEQVDVEKVEAEFKNGLLSIKLPKSQAAKPKKITLTAS